MLLGNSSTNSFWCVLSDVRLSDFGSADCCSYTLFILRAVLPSRPRPMAPSRMLSMCDELTCAPRCAHLVNGGMFKILLDAGPRFNAFNRHCRVLLRHQQRTREKGNERQMRCSARTLPAGLSGKLYVAVKVEFYMVTS
jgi:hypothetical protein